VRAIGRLLLAAAAVLAGCASSKARGPSSTTATTVRASPLCGGDVAGPSAHWIATEGELRAAMGMGGVFGEAPPVDFKKEGVLAVYMGQRPTGGYSMSLQDPTVPIANGVGTVTVKFDEPPPGAMVAQVLTSPCLLVKMGKAGLRSLRVVDPAGNLHATASVSGPPQPPPQRPPGY
jgi:hypothetical protein